MNDNVTTTEVGIEYWTEKELRDHIAKLELEIELLKARLDECHRTIAELISTRKP